MKKRLFTIIKNEKDIESIQKKSVSPKKGQIERFIYTDKDGLSFNVEVTKSNERNHVTIESSEKEYHPNYQKIIQPSSVLKYDDCKINYANASGGNISGSYTDITCKSDFNIYPTDNMVQIREKFHDSKFEIKRQFNEFKNKSQKN